MQPLDLRRAAVITLALALTGCASPGVPRSPSLNLPEPVRDLAAIRQGDTVTLHLTLPQRNTDHLPLRGDTLTARLCRITEATSTNITTCPSPIDQTFPNHTATAELHDILPSELTTGPAKAIAYRVQILNETGKGAAFSDAAYIASGPAPQKVESLTIQGSRLGTILTWKSIAGDDSQLIFSRTDLAAKPAASQPEPKPSRNPAIPSAIHLKPKSSEDPNTVLLTTDAPRINQLLDTTALANEPYRYTAERRRSIQIGGRTLELRSELATPINFTLHDTYPPPAPTDLTAAASGLSVDLIWQPVDDPGLAGYNIYRQPTNTTSAPTRLNTAPVKLPGYHDQITDQPAAGYTYAVTAVDKAGNESAPCITAVRIAKAP